jgi:hypothetical protein
MQVEVAWPCDLPCWAGAFTYTAGVRCSQILLAIFCLSSSAIGASTSSLPVTRWSQEAANCTFREGGEGRTYYGISSGVVEVVLAVDSRELEKIPHRATPLLSVLLSFQYNGRGQLAIEQGAVALEFVKHSKVTKGSLDPDNMLAHLQQNVDDLTDAVERHDRHTHPEEKSKMEAELQARLKDYTEMMDFISTRALRSTVLNPTNSSVSGWVFFSIKDRWIGPWRRPEQFVLRIPVENTIFEFPFSLPPQPDKIELRRRQNQ